MNFDTVASLIDRLGTLKFFPSSPAVRLALVELMGDLTDDEDKVRWLVGELRLLPEWPGEFGVRKLFTSKFRPKDGIVQSVCACGCGTVYTHRLAATETWPRQISAAASKFLSAPDVVSDDPLLTKAVEIVNEIVALRNDNFKSPPTAKEIAAAPEWLRQLEGYGLREPEEPDEEAERDE